MDVSINWKLTHVRYHKFSLWLLANKSMYISIRAFDYVWRRLNDIERRKLDKLAATVKVI